MINKIVSFSYRNVNIFIKDILIFPKLHYSYSKSIEKYFELKPKFYQVIFGMTSKSYEDKKFDKSRKMAYHFKTEHNTTLAKR